MMGILTFPIKVLTQDSLGRNNMKNKIKKILDKYPIILSKDHMNKLVIEINELFKKRGRDE